MGNGFGFAEKNAVCTETRFSYSYNAVKGDCKDSSCTVGVAQASVTIPGRVHRPREDSDVNSDTACSVHHRDVEADAHRNRP